LRNHDFLYEVTAVFFSPTIEQFNVEFATVSETSASDISFAAGESWVNSQSRKSLMLLKLRND
jgi:hypothetical protein